MIKKDMKNVILHGVCESLIKTLTDNISSKSNLLTSKLIYTVNLDGIMWRIQSALTRAFPNMSEKVNCESSSLFTENRKIKYEKQIDDPLQLTNDVKFFRGTPIFLTVKSTHKMSYHGESTRSIQIPVMYLSTIRTEKNIKNLRLFIKLLVKNGSKHIEEDWGKNTITFTDQNPPTPIYLCGVRRRTFDNVFMTDEQYGSLKESLDNFKAKKSWYEDKGIPYHFGILLHGCPGTGKSCIAQAIADYMDAEFNVISGDQVLQLPSLFGTAIPYDTISRDSYRVILIEDIDCGFSKDEMNPDGIEVNGVALKRKKGLASLLNCLDGVCAPQNVIYVFTTNHIEQLDPALIRPGRIDLKLEIKPVNMETFNKFCKHHYDDTWSVNFPFREGITFAELQTEVMKGKSMSELVGFCRVPPEERK